MIGTKFIPIGFASQAVILAFDNKGTPPTIPSIPTPLIKIGGLSLAERAIRTLTAAGVERFIVVLDARNEQTKEHFSRVAMRYECDLDFVYSDDSLASDAMRVLAAREKTGDHPFLLVAGDCLFDARIVEELLTRGTEKAVLSIVDCAASSPAENVTDCAGAPHLLLYCTGRIFAYLQQDPQQGTRQLCDAVAAARMKGDAESLDIDTIDAYVPAMRRVIRPFLLRIQTGQDVCSAQRHLVESACKGTSDLLATFVNKPIENLIVRHIAGTGITPNQVTVLTNIVAYGATFLFFQGLLVPAALLTFVVSFMDGVDGKLARVQLSSSKLGKLEHAFDLLFENSWYIALGLFLYDAFGLPAAMAPVFILLFDGFSAHCGEAYGKGFPGQAPLADCGAIEKAFRRVDGRKNTYIVVVLIGVLVNAPFHALVCVAGWSCASAVFYCWRAIKHLRAAAPERAFVRARTGSGTAGAGWDHRSAA